MASILVVDHCPDIRELLRDMLEVCGHTVRLFEDPGPVIESGGFVGVDLALLDVYACGLDFIQKEEFGVPFVVSGNYFPAEVLEKVMDWGASAVLLRPFRLQDVRRLVGRVTA